MGGPALRVVKTACGFCPMSCGMEVYLSSEGQPVQVKGMPEHPMSRGSLCPKGRAALERVQSQGRLRHPCLKEKGGWRRLSWEEALDNVADRLLQIRKADGPYAVAIAAGMPVLLSGSTTVGLIRRFAQVFGTPNCFSVESLCYRCRMIGYISTFGRFYTADPERAACIVVWGHNPDASAPPIASRIRKARKRGAKLVVVDPRETPLAKIADIHLRPRPGTDCAALLAMLNVIISERLYDGDFVEKWVSGFGLLEEHVSQYAPERVEKITWIPGGLIREVARLFATTKPACIVQGTNSLDQTSSGLQSSRAIAILQAVTGNVDIPGGFVWVPRLRTNQLLVEHSASGLPLGIDKYPLFYSVHDRVFGEGHLLALLETLLSGKPYRIRAMIIDGSNPLLTWPHSGKVKAALEKLDYIVVIDQIMGETAKLANVVLPAATFLERTELCDYYNLWGIPYVMLRKKVLEFPEAWPDIKIWLELGRRLGYIERIPWATTEELLDYVLAPSGYTVKHLTEVSPEGVFYQEVAYRKFETEGFRTPSGKIELYSSALAELGVAPLPVYVEPQESPIAAPQPSEDYPLILTTGGRSLYYTHSCYRDLPSLRRRQTVPFAEIHPETAAKYGIADGQLGLIETRRGQIQITFRVTEGIMPGIVHVPHGWAQANVNELTEAVAADGATGYPALKSLLCRVSPV